MKKAFAICIVLFAFMVAMVAAVFAGNTNDLAYFGFEELDTSSAVGLADSIIVVESNIPKKGITVQDLSTLIGGDFNPMTTAGDIILGGASGAAGRLAIGTNLFALLSNGTTAAWGAVYQNPMTTAGDLTVGGASGAPARLAIADTSNVLQGGATPAWASGAFTAQVSVSLAELNAGKTIIAAVTGKQIVVLDFNFVMDGAFAALTSAELEDTSATVNVCSLAQAQMTDDAVLSKGITGVTLGVGVAEGLTVSEALVITKTGSDATTATGLVVVITYMLV